MWIQAVLVIAIASSCVVADEATHVYAESEPVVVYANKMGPFNNPLETYAYFELPGCPPASWDHKFPSLGQALVGDELYPMKIAVKFKEEVKHESLCDFTPNDAQKQRWSDMVTQQYWYQLYIDSMPVWASFGKMVDGQPHVYSHQALTIGTNKDHIVFANLSVSDLVPVGGPVKFSYSVTWQTSQVAFEDRFRRYLDNTFFEHRIHWFSIFNSFMMVLFLMGMVIMVLSRTLKNDFARFAAAEQDDTEYGPDSAWAEETGWKQLRGDVHRVPPRPEILAALIGTGWQLAILSLSIVLIAIVSVVYTNPGSLLTYGVLAYAVTSFVAGHISAAQFYDYTLIQPSLGSNWIRCMIYTASLFPCSMMVVGFLMNTVAILYDSAQAIPFGGMVVILFLWALVTVPLAILGTVTGRHRKSPNGNQTSQRPPHVNQIPRIVPPRPWYLQPRAFIVAGGILPFGSIFIELYFVLTSFWNYKLYYVYGFLLLVFLILIVVTGCVAIVSTYIMLSGEEHNWQWTNFLLGASTGGYVALYSVYFFFAKTRMTGFFMFTFYFGYMGMMCVAIGLVCGAVAFTASSLFITRIYRTGKFE